MNIVKQNTARKLLCLLYDVTDFITPKTGVGHASITVWIQKQDGTEYPFDMGALQVTAAFESIATSGTTTTLVDSKLAGKYADDYFNGLLIRTISGTGSGQNLVITDYTGSSGTFTFSTATAPDNTTVYRICKGVADSATSNTLTDSILTEGDDYWNGYELQIIAGTGSGQVRTVTDFDAATDKLTVGENFSPTPDNTSVYSLSDKWAEKGHGRYEISFGTGELDILGDFIYHVTDGQTEYLDFNGKVLVESANLSDLDTDIAENQTDLDAIITTQGTHTTNQTNIEGKIDTVDAVVDLIKPETDKIQSIQTETNKIPTVITNQATIEGKVDALGGITGSFYFGLFVRGDVVRFFLDLDEVPDAAPTIEITRNGVEIVAEVAMTGSAKAYYYDFTITSSAEFGIYTVKYSATISTVEVLSHELFSVRDLTDTATLTQILSDLVTGLVQGRYGVTGAPRIY
jgi:hypothetical protein